MTKAQTPGGEFLGGTVPHILAGLLSCFSYLLNPVLPVIGLIGFEAYEVAQIWEKNDYPAKETLEFMTGFFAGIVILGIIKYGSTIVALLGN